jgi:glycine/D-amino acid oxidase-like deaminating enzyme
MSTLSLDTAAQLYNPSFDPLVDQGVGQAMAYAPTYWVASAGTPPENDGAITHDLDADVVIVGGGFTGLATALFLAREHGIKATLLEANQTAWGCTSRNGGQGQNASGRLYRSQWINRWGIDIAKRLDAEIHGGFETFKSLVSEIDCDAQDYGHLYVAHRDKKMAFLENEAKVMRDIFGYQTRILDRMQLQEEFCHDQEACGALYEPEGVGVHPLKLAYGYQRLARSLGVKINTGSPVIAWSQRNGKHCLETPGGKVHAKVVGLATGAYGGQFLTPHLRNRVMPILSNSMVTRVLTDAELAEISVKKPAFITDTRTLRFYYRLLPDRRMQIGSRSAIHGANATAPKHLQLLRDGLARKFPILHNIPVDYSWWGWVDVSHDMMPRIVQPDPNQSVFYALGYGGNGVSFSAHAGRRLAQRMAGKTDPAFDLPIYNSQLPGHLFAPFRRLGQSLLYRWYYLRDEIL